MTTKTPRLFAKRIDPYDLRDLGPLLGAWERFLSRDVIKDTGKDQKPSGLDVGGGGWMNEKDVEMAARDFPFSPGSVFHVSAKQREPRAKSRPDLFPPKALQLAGQVLAFGEAKHPDEKWKGMTSGEHIGACWRHTLEHQAGNTYDSESGELHLAHAFVRLGMALDQYLGFR